MIFRPECHGAIGDGITDDTNSIQVCLDAIGKLEPDQQGHKGTLSLEKTYYVTRQKMVVDDTTQENGLKTGPHWRVFYVPSGVTIAGKGKVTLLKGGHSVGASSEYTYVFWLGVYFDPKKPRPDKWENEGKSISIRDITIENDPLTLKEGKSENAAIVINRGIDILIDNVTLLHWSRGVKAIGMIRSRIRNCTIEDSRYQGIGVFSSHWHARSGMSDWTKNEHEKNIIEGNQVIGKTRLAGGIYVSGYDTHVRKNRLNFTQGINVEDYANANIDANLIQRGPFAIRAGHLYRGIRSAEVRNNLIEDCVAGIMVNYAQVGVVVSGNIMRDFVQLGGDTVLEPVKKNPGNQPDQPIAYWGYGTDRAGINIVDSANVDVVNNSMMGLSDGTPVGIRVANSRFKTVYLQSLDLKFQKDLDASKISSDLRDELNRSRIYLSSTITVLNVSLDREWLVVDQDRHRKYAIRRESNAHSGEKLNIYATACLDELPAACYSVRRYADCIRITRVDIPLKSKTSLVDSLEEQKMPDFLRGKIVASRFPMSENVSISVVRSRSEWLIRNEDRSSYFVRLEDDKFSIYFDCNANISLRKNVVQMSSGLRIGYYLENQKDYIFENNIASGDLSNRFISSMGDIFDGNALNGKLQISDQPSSLCKRLVMATHPMHPDTAQAYGPCHYDIDPNAVYNEYFPPYPLN